MTLEEAQKVANIIATADGGCSTCVGDLTEKMNETFPEFYFIMTDVDLPPEQPEWSTDPEDAHIPGKYIEVIEAIKDKDNGNG